ncbi:MAG: hypothetical protein RLZZ435_585 [Cyanobacteriota bacterium]|jgi:KaiC/GvpD/RAD55 family RecA-like ATPase
MGSDRCYVSYNKSDRYLLNNVAMKGVQFLVNETGEKTAVQIDLEQWGDLWEDFYDVMISHLRREEPDVEWEELEAEIPEDA